MTTKSSADNERHGISTLLLLVDSRLPTGGHTHSGGIEAAVADGRVRDATSLARYLEGRLATTGYVDAALASATVREIATLSVLNSEAVARCAAPALRRASQLQARGLLRVARRIWPSEELDTLKRSTSAHPLLWPVALGVVARAAGVGSRDAALAGAQSAISGSAWAAVRLLGLDPFAVTQSLAFLADNVDAVALRADAVASAVKSPMHLPSVSSPLQDIAAEQHAKWEMRLFVS